MRRTHAGIDDPHQRRISARRGNLRQIIGRCLSWTSAVERQRRDPVDERDLVDLGQFVDDRGGDARTDQQKTRAVVDVAVNDLAPGRVDGVGGFAHPRLGELIVAWVPEIKLDVQSRAVSGVAQRDEARS